MKNNCNKKSQLFKYLLAVFLISYSIDSFAQAESGITSQRLMEAEKAIKSGEYGEVHSLLVMQRGDIVYEKYFNDWNPDSLHQLQSATKSIVATLLGIALKNDFVKNIDQKVLSFFPDKNIKNVDEWKEDITIEDLLTQRHGLEWTESPWNSPKNTWRKVLSTEGDWYEMILSTPMRENPGKNLNYGNAAPVLVSGIIQQASGMDIDQFAKKYLFDPLEIQKFRFWHGNGGPANNGMALLFLTSRDLAKIGQLYLEGGIWNGEQLLPKNWVREAALNPIIANHWDNRFYRFGYGYLWWNTPSAMGTNPKVASSVYAARGAGGQYLIIHPQEEMVVVITAWSLRKANFLFEIFTKYIQNEKYLDRSLTPETFSADVLSEKVETYLTMSSEEDEIYFARKDSFYVSGGKSTIFNSRKKNGKWTKPVRAPFTGVYSDTGPFITPDGNKLFFTSNRPIKAGEGKEDADIWFMEKEGTSWSKPRHLEIVNSTKTEYSPSVDEFGNLYFGSYREGGFGRGDIWVSKFVDGEYQTPVNLGNTINSEGGEWGSCISPSGDYIIFEASGRESNITNDGDLYISYNKREIWGPAIHLGELNSGGSDLSPRIHGNQLYFSSNRHEDFVIEINNNNVDIYEVHLDKLHDYITKHLVNQ